MRGSRQEMQEWKRVQKAETRKETTTTKEVEFLRVNDSPVAPGKQVPLLSLHMVH